MLSGEVSLSPSFSRSSACRQRIGYGGLWKKKKLKMQGRLEKQRREDLFQAACSLKSPICHIHPSCSLSNLAFHSSSPVVYVQDDFDACLLKSCVFTGLYFIKTHTLHKRVHVLHWYFWPGVCEPVQQCEGIPNEYVHGHSQPPATSVTPGTGSAPS